MNYKNHRTNSNIDKASNIMPSFDKYPRSYVCPVCSKLFAFNRYSISSHLRSHNRKGIITSNNVLNMLKGLFGDYTK